MRTSMGEKPKPIEIDGPVVLRDSKGLPVAGLMVDDVRCVDGFWEFRGWQIGEGEIAIFDSHRSVDFFVKRHHRADVAKDLKLDESPAGFGFLIGLSSDAEELTFTWAPEASKSVFSLRSARAGLASVEPISDDFLRVESYLEVVGFLASAHQVLVAGWVLGESAEQLFLQCDDEFPVRFQAVLPVNRPDVLEAYGIHRLGAASSPGFVARAACAKAPQRVRLLRGKTRDVSQLSMLADKESRVLSGDPVKIFKWLSGINSQSSTLPARFAAIDVPILEEVIKRDRAAWPSLPVQRQAFGVGPKKPLVSIIIPLYKRIDFVEHQLMFFSRDPWIRKNVEIIYVLDDPTLLDVFMTQTRQWYRLFDLPFKWVFGTVNRGFSGANNLGAAEAIGPLLLFMNSDVFPIKDGWLKLLVETLEKTKDAGVVAPKLLHLDGSIQHAGMEFQYRSDLGFCINHHPNMGLSSELDTGGKMPVAVPAVTGACMLIRKSHFDAVGQWDTGYLIGDFEDSDLCHKIAELGLKAVYEPRVSLTHLERQSFVSTGSDDFRYRVVVYNAVRHQKRWLSRLQHVIDAAN